MDNDFHSRRNQHWEDKRILDFCGLAATMTGKIQVANFIQTLICKQSAAGFII